MLRIMDNDELVSFPNEAEWFLKVRSSLCKLKFKWLKSLQYLPSSLESLSSLQNLSIYEVPKLRKLPILPPFLKFLTIKKFHPELHELYGLVEGSEWYKIAHIPYVDISTD
ncbi:hypothetical protein IEQ34_007542 [Dendrobium chrysotoxum]|uniref:Uncharacterized protein n=1 Tax=Dendrobium chrysotoxum TaxID=161865 RepID=A0AAV7GM25_DENCH|nr:hypothetical protein IEQ34_007542 [Dendrobium chrysotoxum]